MNDRAKELSRDALLQLFTDYVGPEYVQSVRNEVRSGRHGGFLFPARTLLILFASRSGSNFLAQLLCSTGWFAEINESFRPSQLKKIAERHGLPDCHAAAQWMIDRRGTAHAFGLKAGFATLIAAAELGALSELLETGHVVLLRRRDRLGQAISLVRSRLAGRTHSGQQERREVTDADYDREAIAFQLDLIGEREQQFEDMAKRFGKDASVVHYEDVCSDPQRHVAAICESMGLPFPENYVPEVRVQILRDDLSERWAKRFRSEPREA